MHIDTVRHSRLIDDRQIFAYTAVCASSLLAVSLACSLTSQHDTACAYRIDVMLMVYYSTMTCGVLACMAAIVIPLSRYE